MWEQHITTSGSGNRALLTSDITYCNPVLLSSRNVLVFDDQFTSPCPLLVLPSDHESLSTPCPALRPRVLVIVLEKP